MRLVIGCPVAERAWILSNWLQAIEEQNIECEIVCVYSTSHDETKQILTEWGVTILHDQLPPRPVHEIDNHSWGTFSKYEYMALLRNKLLAYCACTDTDYFFSLDSDILLPSHGLKTLLDYLQAHEGVVAPAVNMAHFHNTAWNTMSFADPYHPGMAERKTKWPKSGQVDVVMAAMLLDRKGMEARWCAHTQGEDIGFSIDARYKKIPLWWLGEVRCDHVMRRYS